jgi:beta-lactamase superfamily II metal-dependent hydrolase
MFDDYISVDTTPLYKDATGSGKRIHLLWGDGVEVLQRGASRTKVRARGRKITGHVNNSALGGQSLLELYFIDVGQGDGVLIKTPGFKHIMIDGGYPRSNQDTGKSAADFIDWKFYEDYKKNQIKLDAMIASHCDSDHYGGLWDLLNVDESEELDCTSVRVKAFYHAGLARWEKLGGAGGSWLGPYEQAGGEKYFTQLMGNRNSVIASLGSGPGPKLQGWWKEFMQAVVDARWTNNQPTTISRLSHVNSALPGFSSSAGNEPVINILAPAEYDVNGKSGIHRFTGGDSQNTNGNSILLRLDFGRSRILLTGDLNKKSMQALLNDYSGQRQEFECDVAKACHHGSSDVSYAFLRAVQPAVTVLSSGDNEKHDHPRPNILAASATTGYYQESNDQLISPLIYSTELARSVSFGVPFKLEENDANGNVTGTLTGNAFKRARIHFEETKPGDLNPKKKSKSIKDTYVVAGLIYGLVNVRTDGEKILCAIMNEKNGTWQIQTLRSRF